MSWGMRALGDAGAWASSEGVYEPSLLSGPMGVMPGSCLLGNSCSTSRKNRSCRWQ